MKSGRGLELRNFAQFSSNSPLALCPAPHIPEAFGGFCRFAKFENFCIASLPCLPVRLADVFQKMKYQMQNVKSFASLAFPPPGQDGPSNYFNEIVASEENGLGTGKVGNASMNPTKA